MELGQIVCIGQSPSSANLKTLSRIGRDVLVVSTNQKQAKRAAAVRETYLPDHVRFISIGPNSQLPLPAKSVDLLFLVGQSAIRMLADRDCVGNEFDRLLKPDGLIYAEFDGLNARLLNVQGIKSLARFGTQQAFWLTPLVGKMHTAVPLDDPVAVRGFCRQRLSSPTVTVQSLKSVQRRFTKPVKSNGSSSPTARRTTGSSGHLLRRAVRSIAQNAGHGLIRMLESTERSINEQRVLGRLTRRYGLLVGQTLGEHTHRPPRYLCSIAADSGVDISKFSWAMSASAAPGSSSCSPGSASVSGCASSTLARGSYWKRRRNTVSPLVGSVE